MGWVRETRYAAERVFFPFQVVESGGGGGGGVGNGIVVVEKKARGCRC